jgi:hypothetical protein
MVDSFDTPYCMYQGQRGSAASPSAADGLSPSRASFTKWMGGDTAGNGPAEPPDQLPSHPGAPNCPPEHDQDRHGEHEPDRPTMTSWRLSQQERLTNHL